jgi:16S rRNA A1518/A1519 N6-dimethyltransferase RsmA/KsgA/DIM1 with predicted DNA glycosylase/AP lyase activity
MAFQSRRKTIWNNLKKSGITKENLVKLCIQPDMRPEEISIEKWADLYTQNFSILKN